ncbi:hypothetical protein SAMN05421507_102375 [Lentzea jiangxiensis]|uniref:Uncharacterized protein n=1 Tax=Lentzea jiangxiensis TaxID=641025 RepID=A0A1H0J647_9PSEU|nr:hypothetical protein SAMN05421507_102375 [Lentzea jiangxiensis]
MITVNISPAGAAAQEFPFSGPNHGYAGATFDWTGRCTRTSCSATEDRSTYDNLSGRNPYA